MRFESKIVPQVDRLSRPFEHSITWEDDLWRADPVDVEAIHAPARRKFAELLDAVTDERGSAGQARILLFHGQSGAGKTHLIRALRTAAHRASKAYFGYAQMTPDVANYADYYLRRLVNSLEKPYDPDEGGESGLARLTNHLVGDKGVLDPAALEKLREAKLNEAQLAKLVLELADEIVAAPKLDGPEPRHQHRARAALPAALRSAHRPARAAVSLRPAADRPVGGGGGRARPQHGRGARLRDHRVARAADVDGRPRGAGVLHRPGRGPALLRRSPGALPEGGARPDPDRQPGADLDRPRLLPRRLLRHRCATVLAQSYVDRIEKAGPVPLDRDAHGGGGAPDHRQAPGARRRQRAAGRSRRYFGPEFFEEFGGLSTRRILELAQARVREQEGGGRANGATAGEAVGLHLDAGRGAGLRRRQHGRHGGRRARRSTSASCGSASWPSRRRRCRPTTRACSTC